MLILHKIIAAALVLPLLQMSRLTFVDLPGAERLGMDPEVLRLREGLQLNKSLLAFSLVMRRLAQEGSAEFVGYEDAVLTRLLAGDRCVLLSGPC